MNKSLLITVVLATVAAQASQRPFPATPPLAPRCVGSLPATDPNALSRSFVASQGGNSPEAQQYPSPLAAAALGRQSSTARLSESMSDARSAEAHDTLAASAREITPIAHSIVIKAATVTNVATQAALERAENNNSAASSATAIYDSSENYDLPYGIRDFVAERQEDANQINASQAREHARNTIAAMQERLHSLGITAAYPFNDTSSIATTRVLRRPQAVRPQVTGAPILVNGVWVTPVLREQK